MIQITEITRRDIINVLIHDFHAIVSQYEDNDIPYSKKHFYHGLLSEIEFLNRLYTLENLPSYDPRYTNAEGDIRQHTESFNDYSIDWVFHDGRLDLSEGGGDMNFLNFICQIFHPAVRNEKVNWKAALEKINELLLPDGYDIYVSGYLSGREIYGWRTQSSRQKFDMYQMDKIKNLFNSDYINRLVEIMYGAVNTDPNMAIGKAKELLETCAKAILDDQDIEYNDRLSLIELMKKTRESLETFPKEENEDNSSLKSVDRILKSLGSITQGVTELRNSHGDGHGKGREFQNLPTRYARLVVESSVAAVNFMWDAHEVKKNR